MGGYVGVAVPGTHSPVDLVVEERWSDEVHGCFGLAEVDVLAATASALVIEGGQNGDGSEPGGGEVGVRAPWAGGIAVGPSGGGVEAGDG